MIERLRGTQLFGGLDDDVLARLAGMCQTLKIGDGGTLISEGYRSSHDLYLIIEGRYDVITHHPDRPDEAMTLGNLGYDVVGEIGWLVGQGRTATIICRGDVLTVKVDGPGLMAFLEEQPAIGFKVMRYLMKSLSTKLVDANFFLM